MAAYDQPGQSWLERLLDRLLGPRCPRCTERVFPKDQEDHDRRDCGA